jgi:hypothetical protein
MWRRRSGGGGGAVDLDPGEHVRSYLLSGFLRLTVLFGSVICFREGRRKNRWSTKMDEKKTDETLEKWNTEHLCSF